MCVACFTPHPGACCVRQSDLSRRRAWIGTDIVCYHAICRPLAVHCTAAEPVRQTSWRKAARTRHCAVPVDYTRHRQHSRLTALSTHLDSAPPTALLTSHRAGAAGARPDRGPPPLSARAGVARTRRARGARANAGARAALYRTLKRARARARAPREPCLPAALSVCLSVCRVRARRRDARRGDAWRRPRRRRVAARAPRSLAPGAARAPARALRARAPLNLK